METKRPEMENRIQSEAGFTLLEVLISITIFMVGILAIGSMQTAALKTNNTSMGVTEAMNIGQLQIEELLSTPYDPAAPVAALDEANNGTAAHERSFASVSGRQYEVSWDTTAEDLDSDGNDDSLAIEMNVSWNDLYGQRGLTMNFRKTTRF